MKRFLLMMIACCFFAVKGFAQAAPEITFAKTEHDFGKVAIDATDVEYEFTFTNTGNAPLIISDCAVGCGCTVPEYPKEPIRPGYGGRIKVKYTRTSYEHTFSQTVNVRSNAAIPVANITIKGEVSAQAAPHEDPVIADPPNRKWIIISIIVAGTGIISLLSFLFFKRKKMKVEYKSETENSIRKDDNRKKVSNKKKKRGKKKN